MPGGRPTKYRVEFCEQVVELMSEGGSKQECCTLIGVQPHTFIEWTKRHTEFMQAVKRGEGASKAWWERQGRLATFGGTDGFNATSYIFNMKNRFSKMDDFDENWTDKQERHNTGSIGLTDLSQEALDARIKELAAKLGTST